MRYQNYKARMLKIRKVLDFFYRFRFVFAGVAAATIATVVTLDVTKGNITKTSKFEISYNYGESISYSGESFMGDVSFEFRKVGEETWSEETPQFVGEYEARAKSKGNHGYKYSPVTKFEILPIEAKFVVDEEIIAFGNHKPSIDYELLSGDHLEEYNVSYADLTKNKTTAKVDISSIKILNQDNIDVTSCYSLSSEEKEITFQKEKINIAFKDVDKIYDGESVSGDDFEYSGTLFYGGQITFEKTDEQTDIGVYNFTHDISIIGEDGKDYTENYDITVKENTVKINKIPAINVYSNSLNKTYDGEKFDKDEFVINSITGVLPIHHYEVTFTNIDHKDCVNSEDNSFNIVILDKDEKNVSDYYENIIKHPGKINIEKRPITIKSQSLDDYFDNTKKSCEKYDIVSGSLVEGQEIKVLTKSEYIKTGEYDNVQTYDIVDKENESVSYLSNYQVDTNEKGKIKIETKKLAFSFEKEEIFYDGQQHLVYKNNNHGILTEATKNNLPEGWTADAYFPSTFTMKDYEENGYQGKVNDIKVVVKDADGNDIYNDEAGADKNGNYQRSDFSFGALPVSEIKRLNATIDVPTELIERYYANTKLKDRTDFNLKTLITSSGLIDNTVGEVHYKDTLEISYKNDADKNIENYQEAPYKIPLVYTIKNQDNVDVTKNYIIDPETKDYIDLSIKKVDIAVKVKPNVADKVYDGSNEIEPQIEIVSGGLGGETFELVKTKNSQPYKYTVAKADADTYNFTVQKDDIIIKRNNTVVTDNYNITDIAPTTVTISKRNLNVKRTESNKNVIYYDDKEHGVFTDSFELSPVSTSGIDGLVNNTKLGIVHSLSFTDKLSRKDVGEETFSGADAKALAVIKDQNNTVVTDNYNITIEDIYVNIVKKVITYTFPSSVAIYSGSIYDPYSDKTEGTFYKYSDFKGCSYFVSDRGNPSSLEPGDELQFTKPSSTTLSKTIHANTTAEPKYSNDIKYKVIRNKTTDVTKYYDFSTACDNGSITINPAYVYISCSNVNEKPYDGQVISDGPETYFEVKTNTSKKGAYISTLNAGNGFTDNVHFHASFDTITDFMAGPHTYTPTFTWDSTCGAIEGSDFTWDHSGSYQYTINKVDLGIGSIDIDGNLEIRYQYGLVEGDVIYFGDEPLQNGDMVHYENALGTYRIMRGSDDVTSCYNISLYFD